MQGRMLWAAGSPLRGQLSPHLASPTCSPTVPGGALVWGTLSPRPPGRGRGDGKTRSLRLWCWDGPVDKLPRINAWVAASIPSEIQRACAQKVRSLQPPAPARPEPAAAERGRGCGSPAPCVPGPGPVYSRSRFSLWLRWGGARRHRLPRCEGPACGPRLPSAALGCPASETRTAGYQEGTSEHRRELVGI